MTGPVAGTTDLARDGRSFFLASRNGTETVPYKADWTQAIPSRMLLRSKRSRHLIEALSHQPQLGEALPRGRERLAAEHLAPELPGLVEVLHRQADVVDPLDPRVAARDPRGWRPLVMGRLGDAIDMDFTGLGDQIRRVLTIGPSRALVVAALMTAAREDRVDAVGPDAIVERRCVGARTAF